ncbi:MAG: nitroreductase family protein [Methanocellales archaeon]
MDAIECLKTRRSIRKFKKEDVKDEDLKLILECAGLAPSPANWQPWYFVIVKNNELKQKMAKAVLEKLDQALKNPDFAEMHEGIKRNIAYISFFADAPAAVAVFIRPGKFLLARMAMKQGASEYDALKNDGFAVPVAVGAAIQNFCLAAHALGYGTCWMIWPLLAKKEIEEMLMVKPPWELCAIVAMGRPDESPPVRERKKLEEMSRIIP